MNVELREMHQDASCTSAAARVLWIFIIGILVVCAAVLALSVLKCTHSSPYLISDMILNADGESAVINLDDGRLGVCNLGPCDLQVALTGYKSVWAMTQPLSRDCLVFGSVNWGKRGRDIVIWKGGGWTESMHLPPGPPLMCSLTTNMIAAVCNNGERGTQLEFFSIEDGLKIIGNFRDDSSKVFRICDVLTIDTDKVLLHGRCFLETDDKATGESYLYLVEGPSGRVIRRVRVAPEAQYMDSLHLSNDKKYMTFSQPDIIELRDFPSLRLIKSIQFNGVGKHVAVSNGGEFVVFGANQVQIWNTITNETRLLETAKITATPDDDDAVWRAYDGVVMAMRFATSSSRVIIIRRNGDISEWEVSSAHKIRSTKITIDQKNDKGER